MDNSYNFYMAALLCHSIKHCTIMFIACRMLPNNDCIESNTKQFKHKVKHACYESVLETYLCGKCQCFASLEDKITIQQNFILDQLYTLIQNKTARVCNHSFKNKQINQIKTFCSIITFQDIIRQALCNSYQFRFNKINIVCTANYFEYQLKTEYYWYYLFSNMFHALFDVFYHFFVIFR